MDADVAKLLAAGAAIGLGMIGPGIGIGLIGGRAVEAIGRDPETEGTVRNNMILAMVFAESLAIFVLVIVLILRFL